MTHCMSRPLLDCGGWLLDRQKSRPLLFVMDRTTRMIPNVSTSDFVFYEDPFNGLAVPPHLSSVTLSSGL